MRYVCLNQKVSAVEVFSFFSRLIAWRSLTSLHKAIAFAHRKRANLNYSLENNCTSGHLLCHAYSFASHVIEEWALVIQSLRAPFLGGRFWRVSFPPSEQQKFSRRRDQTHHWNFFALIAPLFVYNRVYKAVHLPRTWHNLGLNLE